MELWPPRIDLSKILTPAVRQWLPWAERERVLRECGGSMHPDTLGGWVAVVSPETWVQAPSWHRALDQALDYLLIAPHLWPPVPEAL
jgi:hypothetical protein